MFIIDWILENMFLFMMIMIGVTFGNHAVQRRKIRKLPISTKYATIVDMDILRKTSGDDSYYSYEIVFLDEEGKIRSYPMERKHYNQFEIGMRGELFTQGKHFHSFDGVGKKLKGDETYG